MAKKIIQREKLMKYCAECGHPVELVFEDQFERYQCIECKMIHYNNPRPCVLAIVCHDDQILLTRRTIEPGSGKWDFPGGFLERDEHPEVGLRREFEEELGAVPRNPKLLGFYLDY